MEIKKAFTISMGIIVIVFFLFVMFYGSYVQDRELKRVNSHSKVIAGAMLNFDDRGIMEYVKLACKAYNYSVFQVTHDTGKTFIKLDYSLQKSIDKFLISLNLIPAVNIISDVVYNGKVIGQITVNWYNTAIYIYTYGFILVLLIFTTTWYYLHTIQAKHNLEEYVLKRLNDQKEEIADRKRTEEALQEKEMQYRLIANNVSDVIWTMDMEQRVNYVSPSVLKQRGYTPEEAIQIPLENTLTPDSYEKAIKVFMEEIEKDDESGIPSDRSRILELEQIRKDGSTHWIEATTSFIRDEDGSLTGVIGITRDISERKRIEEHISFLAEIVDIAPNSILVHDFDGRMIYANQRTFEMYGYEKDEFMAMNFHDIDVPESEQLKALRMKHINKTGEASFEASHTRKDGSTFPMLIYVKKIYWSGEPTMLSIGTDITEQKLTEDALRESETKFRGLVESSCDWIWEVNSKGVYSYASPQVETLMGYKPEEVIGKMPYDLMPQEEVKQISMKLKDAAENNRPIIALENINLHKDGRRIIFETNGVPVLDEDEKVIGYRGVGRDITERKHAEEELRNLRNYLANIIDSMPSVLVGVDTDGKVTQWNKTAEQSSGIAADKAHGKILSDVFPEMASEMENISESIKTRETKLERKKLRHSKNGIGYEDITIYPLITNGLNGAVIRIDDVTDKVRMEEMMIQSEKMLSVGGLATGMAHEINNPLAGMMQTAENISNRLTNMNLPANLRSAEEVGVTMKSIGAYMEKRGILRMTTAINKSGRRVAAIVDNMLNFARKNDDVASYHDPVNLIDRTLELAATDYNLKKQYDFKAIKIVKEYEDKLPFIPCEAGKIQQVLLNIFRNGAQIMTEHFAGHGDRIKETKVLRFILRMVKEETTGMLRIEIEDNGPGMDEATCKRVFEPFFTTKPIGEGTGLGLSISYFIITENHRGTMNVISEPDKGANFIIRLPLMRKN